MKFFDINNYKAKTFVIAEAANNHMCDIHTAKVMIEEAHAAGADAIKFQTYKAEKLVRKDAMSYWEGKKISQLEYYSRLDKFGHDEYNELFKFAKKLGIIAFSTPFDIESANMLNDLGVDLFKIASCDITNLKLIKHVASFGKPMIISTGGANLSEIETAIVSCRKQNNTDIAVLSCMLKYPTPFKNANLHKIQEIKRFFPSVVVGLSDHTPPDENMIIPSAAVAMGARVVEKHFTLCRTWKGSGHSFSVEPSDLKKMIDNIRLIEQTLGYYSVNPREIEKETIQNARRSIVAAYDIPTGTVLTEQELEFKRPGDGIPPNELNSVIGKTLEIDVMKDDLILSNMLKI